jgi:hypothetical protein
LQKDFFADKHGRIVVSHIGRFEDLSGSLREFSRSLGFDLSVPYLNKSQRKSYQEYYDESTREIVANAFADDIEFFGYDF